MTIKSKYAGTCKSCGNPIAKGEQIEWERYEGAKHLTCSKARRPSQEDYPCSDMGYEDSCAQACDMDNY